MDKDKLKALIDADDWDAAIRGVAEMMIANTSGAHPNSGPTTAPVPPGTGTGTGQP